VLFSPFLLITGANLKSKISPQIRNFLLTIPKSLFSSDVNSHPFMFASSQRDAPQRSGIRGRLVKN